MKLPKFYNPFKAHIVELANGGFAVRRYTLFVGWEYKEHTTFKNEDIHWWVFPEFIGYHCLVKTLEDAIILREKVKVKEQPMKVVKVHG